MAMLAHTDVWPVRLMLLTCGLACALGSGATANDLLLQPLSLYDEPAPVQATETPASEPFKPIDAVGINIRPPAGELPANRAAGHFEAAAVDLPFDHRAWSPAAYHWAATGLCHRPLYFEQPNVERYGWNCGLAQPVISGAHFFATVPMMPYLMGAQRPGECVYTLGQDRPGSDVPFRRQRVPLSAPGAIVEGAVVTGLIFAIP